MIACYSRCIHNTKVGTLISWLRKQCQSNVLASFPCRPSPSFLSLAICLTILHATGAGQGPRDEASNVLYYVSFVLGKTAQEKWKEVNMDCTDTTTRLTNILYCPCGCSQFKLKKLRVGGCTEEVLERFSYPCTSAHPRCNVSCQGIYTCIVI